MPQNYTIPIEEGSSNCFEQGGECSTEGYYCSGSKNARSDDGCCPVKTTFDMMSESCIVECIGDPAVDAEECSQIIKELVQAGYLPHDKELGVNDTEAGHATEETTTKTEETTKASHEPEIVFNETPASEYPPSQFEAPEAHENLTQPALQEDAETKQSEQGVGKSFFWGTCEKGSPLTKTACWVTDFTLSILPVIDVPIGIRDLVFFCRKDADDRFIDNTLCGLSMTNLWVAVIKVLTISTIIGLLVVTAADAELTGFKRILLVAKQTLKAGADNFARHLVFLRSGGKKLFAGFLGVKKIWSPKSWAKAADTAVKIIKTLPETLTKLYRDYPLETVKKVVFSFADYIYLARAALFDSILPGIAKFNVFDNPKLAYLAFRKAAGRLMGAVTMAGDSVARIISSLTAKFSARIWKESVEFLADFAEKYPGKVILTESLAHGTASIIKYGSRKNADAVVAEYGREVAEDVFDSAGKSMDTAVKNARSGKFSEKGAFLADSKSVNKYGKQYGASKGRIFVTDPGQINLNRLGDKKYLQELEGGLGLKKGTLSTAESIAYVEIPDISSKFIKESSGIPMAKHGEGPLFMPNTGATVGGMPERVIAPMDVSDFVTHIKVK